MSREVETLQVHHTTLVSLSHLSAWPSFFRDNFVALHSLLLFSAFCLGSTNSSSFLFKGILIKRYWAPAGNVGLHALACGTRELKFRGRKALYFTCCLSSLEKKKKERERKVKKRKFSSHLSFYFYSPFSLSFKLIPDTGKKNRFCDLKTCLSPFLKTILDTMS